MAETFKQKSFLLIATAGISLMLGVCPGVHAQEPADGSPQNVQIPVQPPDSAPKAAAAKPQPMKPAPKPAPKPKKKKPQSTPVKAKKKPAPKVPAEDAAAEPDKILYDRALKDLKGGRYTEGRLTLQTLINSYPDSEFLAKAKLSVADSYYKEGGTSSTTQAIQEYKDFITFFPFLDEAAYAQMQVGMAHYRMMEKSDRDTTQGQEAEDEFQAFILKYPQSPLVPKAEQYLRDVQEILADGEYRIAHYYYTKMDFRAAAARLLEVTDRYPLYSQTGDALWMLGSIYSRAKQFSKNEDEKNHWGDLAAKCYSRILQDYPLSSRAVDARARLQSMGMPIPKANPDSLARMQKDQLYEKQHHQIAALRLPIGMIKGSPDISTASHAGEPQLNPPTDAVSATDVLRPGAQGPAFTVTTSVPASSSPEPGSDAAPVDAVPVPSSTATGAAGNSMGMQIITTPNDPNSPSADAPPNPAPTSDTTSSVPVLAPASPDAKAATSGSGSAATAAPSADPPATGAPVSASESSSSAPQGGSTATPSDSAAPASAAKAQAAPSNPNQESTSKKKKGVKKLIPW